MSGNELYNSYSARSHGDALPPPVPEYSEAETGRCRTTGSPSCRRMLADKLPSTTGTSKRTGCPSSHLCLHIDDFPDDGRSHRLDLGVRQRHLYCFAIFLPVPVGECPGKYSSSRTAPSTSIFTEARGDGPPAASVPPVLLTVFFAASLTSISKSAASVKIDVDARVLGTFAYGTAKNSQNSTMAAATDADPRRGICRHQGEVSMVQTKMTCSRFSLSIRHRWPSLLHLHRPVSASKYSGTGGGKHAGWTWCHCC